MKRFVASLALISVLSISSLAGDIPTSGSPAPCVDNCVLGEPAPGDIPTDGIADVASEGLLDLVGALSSLAF